MPEASRAGATHLRRILPEEIIVWEILVRLPPKPLIRCRAVCRSWHRATSTRPFLLAQHGHQPNLPIISGGEHGNCSYDDFLTFDHRAADAQLHAVARLDASFNLEVSCDGLFVLSKRGTTGTSFCVCNPVTREHAPIGTPWDFSVFSVLGMYLHRPTGEYRLLLHRGSTVGPLLPQGTTGWYVFSLGSDQPPRYIGGPDAASGLSFRTPAMVRDSVHWYSMQHQGETRLIIVFNTTTESFRHMRGAPVDPTKSIIIFEMDDKLGTCSYNDAMGDVDIWVLQNYECEVWKHKYVVKLPVKEIRGQLGCWSDDSYGNIVSVDGDILLLVSLGGWMFYVNTDGKLVHSFHRDGQQIYACDIRLKQTLVPHNFFTTSEGYDVNASPFL
ncbi:unnamed protein product [Alopecurus aequalis]